LHERGGDVGVAQLKHPVWQAVNARQKLYAKKKLPLESKDQRYSQVIRDIQRQVMPFGMPPERLREVHEKGMARMIMENKKAPRPIRGIIAGTVGSVESISYFPYSIIGVKTPPPPPNPLTEGSEEYKIASAFTDVFLGSIFWEIGPGKIGGWIKQTETYRKIARAVKFSRAYKFYYEKIKVPTKTFVQTRIKLPAQKWLAEHWGWYGKRISGRLAPGIVDIPEFARPTAHSLWKQQLAWELAETPKTSALLITKYAGVGQRTSAWVSEHWLKKITGGLSYALIKPELETLTPIKERPKLPYIPETVETASGQSLIKSILGFSLAEFTKLFPHSTSKPKKALDHLIKPIIENKTKSILISRSKKKVVGYPRTSLSQISETIYPKTNKTLLAPPKKPEFLLPKHKKRRGKRLPYGFYGWLKVEVPVASPERMLKMVTGGRKK